MIGRSIGQGGATLLASVSLWACSEGADPSPEPIGDLAEPIIHGAPAAGAKYAAVGALVFTRPEVGAVDVFCSGTLVAPQALVTARHCTQNIDFARQFGGDVAMAFGEDAFHPTQLIPLTDYEAAAPGPGDESGVLGDGGRDVAVVHLASAPMGIKPAKLGRFEERMLGDEFKIAGFGISNVEGDYGRRLVGHATARAVRGHWYKLLFRGDFHAYLHWYFTDSATALPSKAEAKEWWTDFELEPHYELLAGGRPGEAVSCFGDSGGPLLRGTKASNMTVYGVGFGSEATFSTACGLGGAYLVFNRKMLQFVEDAL